MAIVFTKQKKSQKILIIILIAVVAIAFFVFSQAFLKKESFYVPFVEVHRVPEINFEAIEKTKEFQPFAEIEPFEEIFPTEDDPREVRIGRENPFLSY